MRVQRRHWVGAIAVAAAVAAVAVVWNHTQFAAREVGRRFTENLLQERGYRLEMRGLRGTPVGDLLLIEPRVTTLATPVDTLLQAHAVRVRVRSWRGLVRGRVAIGRLRIEQPQVHLPAAWPQAAPAAAPDAGARFPRLDIDAIEIEGGAVRDAQGRVRAAGLDALVQVRSRRDRIEIEIDRARAELPSDSLHVESLRLDAVWRGDSLVVSDLDLTTAASRIEGGAAWERAGGGLLVARLDLDPLDGRELGRFVPQLGREGAVRGPLRIEREGARTRVRGTLSGRVDGIDMAGVELDAVADATGVRVDRARGEAAGARLDLACDLRHGAVSGQVAFVDLDLHALAPEAARSLPPHRLAGQARFARPATSDSLRVAVDLEPSLVGRMPIRAASGVVAWRGTGFALQDVRVETPYGRLRAEGHLDDATVGLDFDVEAEDVSGALAVFGHAGPVGDLRAEGRIEGARTAPRLEADAAFDAWRVGPLTARDGRFVVWAHDLLHRRADVELRVDSVRVRSRRFEDLSADLALDGDRVRVERAQASRGDTLLAAAATWTPMPTDWTGARGRTSHLRLETALLRLGAQELRVEDPATIWWRGGRVRVDSLQVASRGGTGSLSGTLDRDARTLDVRAGALGVDLAFAAQLLPGRPPLAGRAFGEVALAGDWEATRLDVAMRVTNGRYGELPVDSLTVDIATAGDAVLARLLRIATPHGDVRGTLRLARLPSVAGLFGDRGSTRERWAQTPVEGTLRLDGLDVARFAGRGDPAAMPRFGARVSADVVVSGTLGAPRVAARGRADDAHVGPREIGSVDFDVESTARSIVLRQAQVHNEGQMLRLRAEVPARIDFTRGLTLDREEPLLASVVLPRSSFTLVQRFVPLFEPALPGMNAGEVEAELEVSGTLAAPRVRGDFAVHDAAFTLRDMEEVFRDVDARGRFEESTLYVETLTARTGRDGRVSGSGSVDLDGAVVTGYRWRFALDQVPVYSLPEVTAVVAGSLRIDGVRVGEEVGVVPFVRDTLHVGEALITQEFSAGEGEIFDTDTPEWLSDVTLRAPDGNVRLRNSQVEADLAGTLRILRTRRQLDLQGEVTVRRGRYLDLVNYFRITGGRLDFGANPGFNPALDIQGETGRPGSRVYIHLTGSAMAPQLSFRSEREGVEGVAQIEEQVIGRIGSGGAVASNAVATVGGGLLRELQFLRGQNISVDPAGEDPLSEPGDTRNEFGVNLSTGFAVSDNAYLVYTQGVRSDIQQRAAVEIGLRRWPLLLEAAYERRNLSEGGPDQSQNAFDVNLKYRHEY